jgi:hypothetical protein
MAKVPRYFCGGGRSDTETVAYDERPDIGNIAGGFEGAIWLLTGWI